MGWFTYYWQCDKCKYQTIYTSRQSHPSLKHKCKTNTMKAIETAKQVQELKPLIDSASYLIKQIEICDKQLTNLRALPPLYQERLQEEVAMWRTNREGYMECLNRVKAQLCAN